MQNLAAPQPRRDGDTSLNRSVGLIGLVLYGLGVTIGAGIYVLVGETVLRAGSFAPAAFFLSAFVMAFTAGSFAELAGRVPKAAGEANYVEAAFRAAPLTVFVGLAILFEAMIAAAAIAVGAAGYLAEIIALPQPVLICIVVLVMASVAGWGIRETIVVAGIMTVAEVAGLLVIIGAGIWDDPDVLTALPAALMPPPSDWIAVSGVLSASLIAFFAYIGFDDVVNLVEEARNPKRIMPWALAITLVAVMAIYVLVSHIAATAIPAGDFATTSAPISLLFARLTGIPPLAITIIAILATMNGVGIILVMASRVAYGMSREGRLPKWLGKVDHRTRTPLRATVCVTIVVLGMAIFTPLDTLAETTSEVLLVVFVFVNAALVALKLRGVPAPDDAFRVPLLVPVVGALLCLLLLVAGQIAGA